MRGTFTPEEAAGLAEAFARVRPPDADWSPGELPDNEAAIAGWLEITRYMRNQLLRDGDVFSMAQGIELRVPFVDVRLAEALLELPPAYRLEKGKKLLVDAMPEIPDWVRNRPKQGFVFPFARWMESALGGMLQEAREASPVPLVAWYRVWAVAVGARAVGAAARGQ